MDDLTELYQQVILDHNRRPRHFGPLAAATSSANGYNPVCGDRITVHVRVADGSVADATFEGSGCAISRASASLMTDAVIGRPVADADRLFKEFQAMVTTNPAVAIPKELSAALGKLVALGGVRAFPSRIKCATLSWHAFHAALGSSNNPVTTE